MSEDKSKNRSKKSAPERSLKSGKINQQAKTGGRTQKGLGKGFGSLLPQNFDQTILLDKQDRIQKVNINQIVADPKQPRQHFDEQTIKELAVSIKRYGILQPLVVSPEESGSPGLYKLIAGERRLRAATSLGLKDVPVIIKSFQEIERLEVSLIENVQRVDLSSIEQAISMVRLHEQFNVSYDEIAKRLGKAPSTVANIVRLLQLPDFARQALSEGKISEGHARQVLALKDKKLQRELVNGIIQNGWTVRMAESFVNNNKAAAGGGVNLATPKNSAYKPNKQVSRTLSKAWGGEFSVSEPTKGQGGRIVVRFNDDIVFKKFINFIERG